MISPYPTLVVSKEKCEEGYGWLFCQGTFGEMSVFVFVTVAPLTFPMQQWELIFQNKRILLRIVHILSWH